MYLKKEIVGRHTIRSLILKGFLRKCEAEDAVFFSAPGTALLFTSRHSCACKSFLSSDHVSMAAEKNKGHVLALGFVVLFLDFFFFSCFISVKILSVPN